jgi:lipoprotein NlpI
LKRFDAEAELVAAETLTGTRAAAMRSLLSRVERKAIESEISATFEKLYPGAQMNEPLEIQDDTEMNRLVITAHLHIPELARKVDNSWVIPYRPSSLTGIVNSVTSSNRTLPMKVQAFPYSAHYSLDLELPDEVASIRDPKTDRLNGQFFDYTAIQSFRGNRAKVEIAFHALADEVPAKKVPEYSADVRKLNELTHWAVVVVPDDVKEKGTFGVEKSLKSTLISRQRDEITKLTKSIDSQKLGGADLARAYCERSAAHYTLEEFDTALEDANRAVALAPTDADMLSCRGEAYYASGDFAHAVADTSRAVVLGEGGAPYLRQRGQARYYMKKFADAADDFARASGLEHDASAQAYTDLWAVSAHQRAGKPLPADISERAAAHAHGEWPWPALAMMTGKLSVDELLKVVNAQKGDELTTTQTEAYFYLGQHYMTQGNRSSAREAFEKVRSLGLIPYIEYISAAFELKDLGGATAAP